MIAKVRRLSTCCFKFGLFISFALLKNSYSLQTLVKHVRHIHELFQYTMNRCIEKESATAAADSNKKINF